MMKDSIHMMQTLCKEFLRFIYPSRCLYCDEEVEIKHLCEKCINSLTLAYHLPEEKEVYCFEQVSSAKELLKRYEKTQFKNLGKLILSLMVVKFVNQGWEIPDLIISGVKEEASLYRSSSFNRLLAKAFANSLGVAYRDLLTYALSDRVYNEQGQLEGYVGVKGSEYIGKKILIIQDEMTVISKTYTKIFPNSYVLTFLSNSISVELT